MQTETYFEYQDNFHVDFWEWNNVIEDDGGRDIQDVAFMEGHLIL